METTLLVFLAVLLTSAVTAFAALAYLTRGRRDLRQEVSSGQLALYQRLEGLDQRLSQRLDALQGSVGQTLASSTETMGRIGQQLGALGKSAERIRDVDVIAAARTAGLVDTKVVSFSATHTALKLVVPLTQRAKRRHRGVAVRRRRSA